MIFKQDESRRAFVYGPFSGELNAADGVKVVGESIRFAKSTWPTESDCEDWLRKQTGDDVLRVKSVITSTKAIELDDAEWAAMSRHMTSPDNVKRESFRIYRSWLANNIVDRDQERFPLSMLKDFASTLPGKAKLLNHSWYEGEPEGRYYAAEIVEVTESEMLAMVGAVPIKNMAGLITKAKEADGGLYWLVGKFFVPANDAELIFKIDAGIYSFESIGFRAPQRQKITDEDGNVVWYEWLSDKNRSAEATEGSWVFLGSQYGARTGKSAVRQPGEFTVDDVEDIIETVFAKHFAKPEQKKQEEIGDMMKIKIAGTEYEIDSANVESIEKMTAEIEAKLASAEETAKTIREEIAAMKKVLDAAGVKSEEDAVVISTDAKAYRDGVIDDAMKYGQLAGAVPTEEDGAKAHRETLAKLTTAEVKGLGDGYRKLWEKANPPAAQIKPENVEDKKAAVNPDAPNARLNGLPF